MMKTMTAPLAPVDAEEAENVIHSLHASPNDAVDYPRLQRALELASAAVLAVDVLVVFFSVIWRYALHDPLEWSEEVARALMITLVFFGAASVLGRSRHVGIDSLRGVFPKSWLPYVLRLCDWVIAFISLSLAYTTWLLLEISNDQTTPSGLPQTIFVLPVLIGSLLLSVFALTHALKKFGRHALVSGLIGAVVVGSVLALQAIWPDHALRPMHVLLFGFLFCLVAGVPIAFALTFGALMFFLLEPSLSVMVFAQQVAAGTDHFVMLAVPFFILAGMVMECNGMSSRLIELLLRMFGRLRGGLNLIMVTAMAFFSGVSGSKLADVAAVGGILMPAVRQTKQNPNEAAGLLAASAIMAETIPPCINMIILGFVANLSIGGLFLAGILPALAMAIALCIMAYYTGRKVDVSVVFIKPRPLGKLIGGALVGLIMIVMIGKGVASGIATSTEISSFAVVYAIVVGWLAFRELNRKVLVKLFVDAASMSGMVLFIVAAASSVAYALTVEQIPHALAELMVSLAHDYGSWMFILISVLALILFGAVLEGAPALIIFGPLLTPIAVQLGYNPLHFAIILVISMGIGLFSPPFGLGMYATCAIAQVRLQDVVKPYLKYLAILLVTLVVIIVWPDLSLWLPRRFGFS
jgi:tripartite ATP-independent transporter DctM subunit